jgi:hypothetical protein
MAAELGWSGGGDREARAHGARTTPRREAKTREAAGRGEHGDPFKGARRRRRRPTATGDEEGKIGINESETNSNPSLSKAIQPMIPKRKR